MAITKNLRSNKKSSLWLIWVLAVFFFSCTSNHLVDVNQSVTDNNWLYAKSLKTKFEIKDTTALYGLSFKIRNTVDYRYSNIYVLVRLKGQGINKTTRFQFQMADSNGQWTGKGSGDLFMNTFTLFKDFRFPKSGIYEFEIEQNMRDNPLTGISDVGLTISPLSKN